MNQRIWIPIAALILILACGAPGRPPAAGPDLLATMAASTPVPGNLGPSPAVVATSGFNLPTPGSTLVVPTSSQTNQPTGKIVFTCQVYKVIAANQICIINADGTGFRQVRVGYGR